MDRQTALVIGITALAVLALGLSAATVPETSQTESGGEEGGESTAEDVGINQSEPPNSTATGTDGLSTSFDRVLFILLAVAAVGSLLYILLYRREALAVLGVFAVVVLLFWILLQFVGDLSIPDGVPFLNGDGDPGGGNGDDGGGSDTSGEATSFAVLVILIVGLITGVLLWVLRSTATENSPEDGESNAPDKKVGEIAGTTADRLEGQRGDVRADNAIYRAWEQMTEQLAVPNDSSTTPQEFATAAFEAGLDREDVDELTELFQDVRYGGHTPTTDREKRAIEILRRIEKKYGGTDAQ